MITKKLENETSRIADIEGNDERSLYTTMGDIKKAVDELPEVGSVVYRALQAGDPEAPPTNAPWICRIAVVKDASNRTVTWSQIASIISVITGSPTTLVEESY